MSRRKEQSLADFAHILRDGLSSHQSYVVLKQKHRSAVYLCFKPFVTRLSESVIYLGGKLSAFVEQGHQKANEVGVTELKGAFRKLPHDRSEGGRRVGSNGGFYIAAGRGDRQKFEVKFDKAHVVSKLLAGIEDALKIEISNPDEVKCFLSYIYKQQLPQLFNDHASESKLPERTVGKRTELLLGQKHTHAYNSESLLPFQQQHGLDEKRVEKVAKAA